MDSKQDTPASSTITRGTFGFIELDQTLLGVAEREKRAAVVLHVFRNGDLLVHYCGNKRFHAIVPEDAFTPSREAFWSEGSSFEPEWDEGTCRCTNQWGERSGPDNCMTDEEARLGF